MPSNDNTKHPLFSKRHYSIIAKVLGEAQARTMQEDEINLVTDIFCGVFAADNPTFDRDLFKQAKRVYFMACMNRR